MAAWAGGKAVNAAPVATHSRFQAQKATPKATPRTAVTTMSTVRQRTLRPVPVPADEGRTAWSAMDSSRLPAPALPGSGSRVCGVPHSQRRGAPLSDVFCCAAELSLLAAEPGEERLAVGHAQAGAGVPAGAGGVGAVAAGGDVPEAPRGPAGTDTGVERGLQQARTPAQRLGEPADQRGPQRGDRARAAVDGGAAVDEHAVPGRRIGVGGHVRHAP